MRRTLSLLLLLGCAHAPAPPPAAEAGLAPRPFTADQIRAAMPVGTDVKFRVEEQGQPPGVLHWRVTAADAETMTMSVELLDNEDHLVSNEGSKTNRWDALVKHASFPADATRRGESTVTVPAGTFACLDYVVRGAGGMVTTYRFAKELPGPPVLLVVEKDGLVVRTMTLLSRK